ncbi:MAG: hypothetical protein CR977_00870 [Gammaproteobacteria bacterium]|nr:MAG: hypothetical protein CR977_00870 [Gammaproteobacteria bacterium]
MPTNKPGKQNSQHLIGRPTKDSAEIGIIHGDNEIETIDSILTERLGGDYNLYRDVLIDSTVFGAWTQRQTALTKLERQVLPANENDPKEVEAAEFIKQQLESLNIDRILKNMQWGVYYGFAVGEILWGVADNRVTLKDIKVRDRANFKFGKKGELLFTAGNDEKAMPPRKFWTYSAGGDTTDNPYGLGLAHFLFWPVLFKKSNVKFWLVGNEKAATSTPHGQYDPRSGTVEEDKRKLSEALNAIRNGSSTISPIGTKIEMLEGESGAGDYEKLCRYMDEAIAIIIAGQVMTSLAVGGQYKAEVQDSVKDDIIKADADLLCSSLSNTVIKWLCEWNFPGVTPPKLWLLTKDEVDNQLQTQSYANMAKVGYRPTLDTVSETLGGDWEEMPKQKTDAGKQGADDERTAENKPQDNGRPDADEKSPRDFAERGNGIAESPTGEDAMANLFGLSDTEINHLLKPETETLLQINAADRNDLANKLLESYPDLTFAELQDFLAKALFIARVAGELDAAAEETE